MPRPRKHNQTIPTHIDQTKIPKGIYWDSSGNGRWYVRDGERAMKVAGPAAKLSDLHDIVEQRKGGSARDTVGYFIERFHASAKFGKLSPRTQSDYERQANIIRSYMTPMGIPLSAVLATRLSPTSIQRVVDKLEDAGTPTKANHLLRYLRRVLSHAVRHEGLPSNPAKGVEQAKERARSGMPSLHAFARVLSFARERSQRQAHSAGSVSAYLPHLMLIATVCRLRGIEVVTITEAQGTPDGIRAVRRKGSRDNVTAWTPELSAAWNELLRIRGDAWERNRVPYPLRPEDRPMFVAEAGHALRKSALDTAWQRLMAMAVKEGVIAEDERFTLHGLKHRGITDSADKAAGGHRTERMRQHYDHDTPVVEPSKTTEFSGVISGVAVTIPVSD
ncbi:integrase [Pseudoxanthomonas kalamensis DSM 18571]|uniref:site-specific integrase n=1 Tax=Pseudoxanthomonas kalamensis TaxID=289483 RepID=UPI001391CCD1|nr:integrase [Pseudoxanthomonas kalamensis]KAF1711103.1 integrase [Pseudoxanthomonas kalamensis DSM 18571]